MDPVSEKIEKKTLNISQIQSAHLFAIRQFRGPIDHHLTMHLLLINIVICIANVDWLCTYRIKRCFIHSHPTQNSFFYRFFFIVYASDLTSVLKCTISL